jgi:Transketolase, thiamine diphosphate binding domain
LSGRPRPPEVRDVGRRPDGCPARPLPLGRLRVRRTITRISSKGHASPLLYALYRAANAIADEELMSYRRLGSRLEGHSASRLAWVDVATGSLGLRLPVGVGIALAGKALDQLPYHLGSHRRQRTRRGLDLGRPSRPKPKQQLPTAAAARP